MIKKSHVNLEFDYAYLLKKINLTLKGHSRSAERTSFIIPEIGFYLDAGISTSGNPNAVFVTHAHSDHSFNLPMVLTDIRTKPNVFVPKAHINFFEDFIQSKHRLSKCDNFVKKNNYTMYGVIPGDYFDILIKNTSYRIRVFECFHSIDCVGYAISRFKEKLKKEFSGVNSKEISAMRKNGIQVSETVEDKLLVYVGDSNIKVFDNKLLFDYKYIIVECTFLYSEHNEHAKNRDHISWDDLYPIIKLHSNIEFILIHFSLRYDDEDIKKFFEKEFSDKNISNVFIWLN